MQHFYYSVPLHINGLINGMLNIYYSSFTNFKLLEDDYHFHTCNSKNFVLIQPCYTLKSNTFFFIIMLLFLFWHLMVRCIEKVIFHLKFVLNPTIMLIFSLSFTWKAYLNCTEPFRKKLGGSCVYSVFQQQ